MPVPDNQILAFLLQYGYWIAIPIMILEGPIITIVMGFLCSFGFFNIFLVIFLGMVSDLVSDAIYYWSGYKGGPKVLEKLKIPAADNNQSLIDLRKKFDAHPGRIFFSVKVLTGIAHSTFVLAGVTRVPYRAVLKNSVPGGLVWSAGLALLGFYFGKNAVSIQKFLSVTGLVFFGLLVVFLFYKFWFGKYIAKKYLVWKEKIDHAVKGGL